MTELQEKLKSLGLSEEMTHRVIETVAGVVKSKIPTSCHGMIDDALAGKTPDVSGLLGRLGGFFGGK